LQATALKDLQKFTGDPTQKVTHFINAVEQLRFFSPLNDVMLHAIATINLGGSASNWYDNNKDSLNSWSLLKTNLLARFKLSLSAAKTQLKPIVNNLVNHYWYITTTLLIYVNKSMRICHFI